MRNFAALLVVMVMFVALCGVRVLAEGDPVAVWLAPDSSQIRYSPRNWDLTKLPYEATTICAGSFFEFSLNASAEAGAVSATFGFEMRGITKPLPTLAVYLDGGAPTFYPMAAAVTAALGTPAPGAHTVRVVLANLSESLEHWTRPYRTGMLFNGLELSGAAVGPTPAAPAKRILFVGDSITQGVRTRNADAKGDSSTWDDSTLTYGTLTAAALGYDLANVGFGRQGLTVIGNGGIPLVCYSVGYVSDGVPVSAAFQPDITVINQGTNDGAADAATFLFHYKLMLSTIRRMHPFTEVVCLIPGGGYSKVNIAKAVKEYLAVSGDTRVRVVDGAKWIVTGTFGKVTADTTDGVHPNATGHKKMADQLVVALRDLGLTK